MFTYQGLDLQPKDHTKKHVYDCGKSQHPRANPARHTKDPRFRASVCHQGPKFSSGTIIQHDRPRINIFLSPPPKRDNDVQHLHTTIMKKGVACPKNGEVDGHKIDLHIFLHIYIYIYMYAYIYIYTYTYFHTFIHVHTYMCIYIYRYCNFSRLLPKHLAAAPPGCLTQVQ